MITIIDSPNGTRTIQIEAPQAPLQEALKAPSLERWPHRCRAIFDTGENFRGEPAETQARFVKLDEDGDPLPPDATQFSAVHDNQTGLQWSGTLAEGLVDYASAEKACQALDLAGHGDWRLPTRLELESILDLSRHKPAADPVFFGDTRTDDWYWTSSPCAWRSGASWCVDFGLGNVNLNFHYYRCFVRAVRSVPPAPGQ